MVGVSCPSRQVETNVGMGSGGEHRCPVGGCAAWQPGCGLDFTPLCGGCSCEPFHLAQSACWPKYQVPRFWLHKGQCLLGGGSWQSLRRPGGGLPGRCARPGDEGEVGCCRKPCGTSGRFFLSHIPRTHGKTEAQREEVSCSRFHCKSMQVPL